MINQNNDNQITLKRSLFAQNIRKEQRQRLKQDIRDKFLNQNYQHREQQLNQVNYDDGYFQQFRYECKMKNYDKEIVNQALGYLFSANLAEALVIEKNLKFLSEVTEKINQNVVVSTWQHQILAKIQKKLEQLIKYQIANSPMDQRGNILKTNQLSQLIILGKCFDGLLSIMEKHKCYHRLWIVFSYLRNSELKNYAFESFEHFIQRNIKNFQPIQISTIASSLQGFFEDCPNKLTNTITILDQLFVFYNISPFDSCKLLDVLVQQILIEPNLKQKVQILVSNTNLIQNITQKLDKTLYQEPRNYFDLVTKIAFFVAKLFSVEDQKLCEDVYMKNVMILYHIRSWLPIQPNVSTAMLEHIGQGTLVHQSHKCTTYMIFALTNMVASHQSFLQTILVKTDIFRALLIMYKLVPVTCRQQISIFFYNIVSRSSIGDLRIILQNKMPEMIVEMLKETNSIIIKKALGIIIVASKCLQEGQKAKNQWLYNKNRLKFHLQSLGVSKYLDSLVTSPQPNIAQKAMQALQILN